MKFLWSTLAIYANDETYLKQLWRLFPHFYILERHLSFQLCNENSTANYVTLVGDRIIKVFRWFRKIWVDKLVRISEKMKQSPKFEIGTILKFLMSENIAETGRMIYKLTPISNQEKALTWSAILWLHC